MHRMARRSGGEADGETEETGRGQAAGGGPRGAVEVTRERIRAEIIAIEWTFPEVALLPRDRATHGLD